MAEARGGGLWDGDERRRRARSLLDRDPSWPSLPEVDFLRASERRSRGRRLAIGGAGPGGRAGLSAFATYVARDARMARTAQELARAALAVGERPDELTASLLLSLRSLDESPSAEGWRAFAGAVALSPGLVGRFHTDSPPLTLVASPDGKTLVLAGKDAKIVFLDGELRKTCEIQGEKAVRRIVFFPNGRFMEGIWEDDAGVTVWSVKNGKTILVSPSGPAFVTASAFSSGDEGLAIGTSDLGGKPIQVYDLRYPDVPPRLFPLEGRSVALAFGREGRSLLAVGRGSAQVWSAWDSTPLAEPRRIAWPTKTVEAAADEGLRRLAIAGLGSEPPTGAWSLRSGKPEESSHNLGVAEHVAMATDGSAAVVSRWDGTGNGPGTEIMLFRENCQEDRTTWDEGDTLRLSSHLSTLAFSPTGREILASSEDGAVLVFSLGVDALDGGRLRRIARLVHEGPVLNAAVFRLNGNGPFRVATVSGNVEVRV